MAETFLALSYDLDGFFSLDYFLDNSAEFTTSVSTLLMAKLYGLLILN